MTTAVEEAPVIEAVAEMVGTSFAGASAAPAPAPAEEEAEKFDFDLAFQNRIRTLAITDQSFMRKVGHLLKPSYFESQEDAAAMAVVMNHWRIYECVIGDKTVAKMAIKRAMDAKVLNKDAGPIVSGGFRAAFAEVNELRTGEAHGLNADFVAEQVVTFVRQAALFDAVSRAAGLLDRPDKYADIEKMIGDAVKIAAEANEAGGDFMERLKSRTQEREEQLAGKRPPRGITTGNVELDKVLFHRGWGRKELSIIMGGPKSGKTMSLVEFALAAMKASYNVLYVTLEVAARIIEERADANITEVSMADLVGDFAQVNDKVEKLAISGACGRLYIAEYPSGSLTPAMLRGLLERHKAKGWTYDLIVVDYADLMAPDWRTNDPIENSKQIYIGLRAIGQEQNAALLTATQSNREGAKAITAKAENVSDDFNKVRTADLFITINSTEEERRDKKARLYFAASRNQRGDMTVFIETDFDRSKFLARILRIE